MNDENLLAELQQPASLWNLPEFLEKYTLHDSGLQEARLTLNSGLLVFVDWDLFWNTTIPKSFDTLVIQFTTPYIVNWIQGTWYQSTLDGASSTLVSQAEKERMLENSTIDLNAYQQQNEEMKPYMFDDSLTRSIFLGINWSRIEVLHGPQVRILCFNETDAIAFIPQV